MKPFRFGVTAPGANDGADWREQARRVEGLGFDVLTVADHIAELWSPFSALAAAAEATTRLRVGTLVLNNDFRHPAIVAREAATLDALSGGRFELGLGAGHSRPEYEAIGLPFDPAGVRVARLAESVHVVRRLFRGEAVSFAGEHYTLREHALFPVPAAAPRILVGGNGRRLLELAAREADIVGFTGIGRTLADGQRGETTGFAAERVDERVALVRQAAGDRFSALELHALVQAVVETDDREAGAQRVGQRTGLTAEEVLGSPFLLVGSPAQMGDDLRYRRERFGISYYSVFWHSLEAMAKVIALLR
jgi:probable F420-dependent oxidoreductase